MPQMHDKSSTGQSNGQSIGERIRAQLRELEDEIDKLDEKSRDFEQSVKREFGKRAEEFRGRVSDGESRVDAFLKTSEAELERAGAALDKTLLALRKGYDSFIGEMRDKDSEK